MMIHVGYYYMSEVRRQDEARKRAQAKNLFVRTLPLYFLHTVNILLNK